MPGFTNEREALRVLAYLHQDSGVFHGDVPPFFNARRRSIWSVDVEVGRGGFCSRGGNEVPASATLRVGLATATQRSSSTMSIHRWIFVPQGAGTRATCREPAARLDAATLGAHCCARSPQVGWSPLPCWEPLHRLEPAALLAHQ